MLYRDTVFVFHAPEPLLIFIYSIPGIQLCWIRSIRLDGHHHRGMYFKHEPELHERHRFESPLTYMPRRIRKKYQDTAEPLPHQDLYYGAPPSQLSGVPIPSVWGAMCEALAEMEGLRSLKMYLGGWNFDTLGFPLRDNLEAQRFVLGPLLRIKERNGNLETFVIEQNWTLREEYRAELATRGLLLQARGQNQLVSSMLEAVP